jgi:hypothetical protein
VVHRDGSLSGYRWGTARKAQLLKAEGCNASIRTAVRLLDHVHLADDPDPAGRVS